MISIPIILSLYAGFIHAYETDHLLAVSNMVSRRQSLRSSIKDGAFWGLGHSSTILIIGVLMILFKVVIPTSYFHYLEALVGLMLIALAIYRLVGFFVGKRKARHDSDNVHAAADTHHSHGLAYGVGLIHGLAGSGALILVIMTQIKSPEAGIIYLLLFCAGCMSGMITAASLFSIPFSRRLIRVRALNALLVMSSAGLCLIFGIKVIYENLTM